MHHYILFIIRISVHSVMSCYGDEGPEDITFKYM